MLTVDYDRLGLRRGELMLDLGCGGGRHAFEAMRRGARVVALDADDVEVKEAAAIMTAMEEAGEISPGQGAMVNGNALTLPFPDRSFDRIIAAEVLEHIPDDVDAMRELARVLKRGGTMAVTIPRWYPELINWALSDEYHMVRGGHVRIYRKQVVEARLASVGLEVRGSHHAHALHSPYWWLKCAVGTTNDTHPLVQAYHRMLVWDIMKAPALTRTADRLLNPVLGKSLVVYAVKP